MIPTDELYAKQWHLHSIGNIERIWDEYSGKGVSVGVYDDGIQYRHPDLNGNYDPSLHVRYNGQVYDGGVDEVLTYQRHGTPVAGLIAAERDGKGAVGVAWGASITGVNILDDGFDNPLFTGPGFDAAIAQTKRFDVVNNSWGADSPDYEPWQNLGTPGSFTAKVEAGWAAAAAEGRGGLGTVVVKSAGNDDLNCNGEGLDASRYSISVSALRADGHVSSYSSYGANLLVAAPAGESVFVGGPRIVTTDRLGDGGYDWWGPDLIPAPSDYTDDFGGTSTAAPIVTGIVSLMLDAAPDLGWRDVQNILATSATHTGREIGRRPDPFDAENEAWFFNGAGNWNGAGMHFSEDYGYGAVDAYNAVRMAEVWHLFTPAPQTSANELVRSTGRVDAGMALPDFGTRTFAFEVGADMEVDFASLTLSLTHDWFNDVRISLISAEGTEVMLKETGSPTFGNPAENGMTWTFGIEAFRGEDPTGTWRLRVEDPMAGMAGALHWVDLDLHGRAAQTNDVYHYTDEFGAMARLGGEAGRRTLVDADGGADWIDAAAVSGNAVVNLNVGQTSTLSGGTFAIAAGTAIEHAVTGDGNDRLTGNALANKLYGMRGNDRLDGRAGADELAGGDGGDVFVCEGAFGGDLVLDFENGLDRLDLDAGLRFASLRLSRSDVDRDGGLDDVRIDVAGRGVIGVLDVSLGAMDAADFLF